MVPVYGYLIDHPDGPIVVDTGVDYGNAFIDQTYQPARTSLVDALKACGVDVADVVAVVNSHLHFDHCGQNEALRARHSHFYVQRAEIAAVEDDPFCERAVEAALNHGGRLDGVAAVAGRGRHGTASELSVEDVADELTAKVTGLLHLVTAASNPLQDVAGRVVALTAPAALEPDPAMAAIGAGRAALDSLVRSLALEFAASGVRVNAVGVGFIDTPRQRTRFASDASPGTSYEQWVDEQVLQRRIPMQRPGKAEEVATAIVWLLSPVASYTTGAVLDVTGGLRSR